MEIQITQKTKIGIVLGVLVAIAIIVIVALAIKPPQNPNDNFNTGPLNERTNRNG